MHALSVLLGLLAGSLTASSPPGGPGSSSPAVEQHNQLKDFEDIEYSLHKVEVDVVDIEKGLDSTEKKEATILFLLVGLVLICCLWRCAKCLCRCGAKRSSEYSHVSHQLDEEEETFKKSIELAEVLRVAMRPRVI
jgi:hypothetical protein